MALPTIKELVAGMVARGMKAPEIRKAVGQICHARRANNIPVPQREGSVEKKQKAKNKRHRHKKKQRHCGERPSGQSPVFFVRCDACRRNLTLRHDPPEDAVCGSCLRPLQILTSQERGRDDSWRTLYEFLDAGGNVPFQWP